MIRGWSREREGVSGREGGDGGSGGGGVGWGGGAGSSSPALFVIRRLNPISDSLVSAGDRIEHSR